MVLIRRGGVPFGGGDVHRTVQGRFGGLGSAPPSLCAFAICTKKSGFFQSLFFMILSRVTREKCGYEPHRVKRRALFPVPTPAYHQIRRRVLRAREIFPEILSGSAPITLNSLVFQWKQGGINIDHGFHNRLHGHCTSRNVHCEERPGVNENKAVTLECLAYSCPQ